jgi:hypothetical protein
LSLGEEHEAVVPNRRHTKQGRPAMAICYHRFEPAYVERFE